MSCMSRGPLPCHANTPCCDQTEIAKRAGTKVTSMGGRVYNLQNNYTNKEYELNLDNPDCCFYVHTNKLPCRHMLIVFHKKGFLGTRRQVAQCLEKYWPKWAWASEYVKMYEGRCIRADVFGPHLCTRAPQGDLRRIISAHHHNRQGKEVVPRRSDTGGNPRQSRLWRSECLRCTTRNLV